MKFLTVAITLFAAANAAVLQKRQDLTQMFEFQSFAASCAADSDQCTFTFKLNGATDCSAQQPAFDAGDHLKLPNIGQTRCGTMQWSATRTVEGGFLVGAKADGASGISGSVELPASDFEVVDGLEKYTGTGIVILYGTATQ